MPTPRISKSSVRAKSAVPAVAEVSAPSLEALARAARTCQACPLYLHATQTVFGAGPAHAKVMLVGEQPGDEEDRRGKPFVGPAGALLDKLMEEVGLDRSTVYVTNAVKHFKFVERGKRRLHQKPKALEVTACKPWLRGEIERVKPVVLVALGATASAALYGSSVSVTRDHGRPVTSPLADACFVTFHPSAALRAPTPEDRARIRKAIADDLRAATRQLLESRRRH